MTKLTKYHDMANVENSYTTYTRDSWELPESGTEIWCTAWDRGQTIKPYGDTCHVIIGSTAYHKDELMDILERNEKNGHTWGIEGVPMIREQKKQGRWEIVEVT